MMRNGSLIDMGRSCIGEFSGKIHEPKVKKQKTKQKTMEKVDFESWKARILEARDMTEEQLKGTVDKLLFLKLGVEAVSPQAAYEYFMSMENVFEKGRDNEDELRKKFWKWLDTYSKMLSVEVDNMRKRTDVEMMSEAQFLHSSTNLK